MSDNILLVGDNVEMRGVLRTSLEQQGYTVLTAANSMEALQVLRGVEPALILLDLMLPVMDGSTFRTEQIRDPRLSTIPTIVYSGHAELKPLIADLGATAHLEKPVKLDTLLRLVATHCRSKPSNQRG